MVAQSTMVARQRLVRALLRAKSTAANPAAKPIAHVAPLSAFEAKALDPSAGSVENKKTGRSARTPAGGAESFRPKTQARHLRAAAHGPGRRGPGRHARDAGLREPRRARDGDGAGQDPPRGGDGARIPRLRRHVRAPRGRARTYHARGAAAAGRAVRSSGRRGRGRSESPPRPRGVSASPRRVAPPRRVRGGAGGRVAATA